MGQLAYPSFIPRGWNKCSQLPFRGKWIKIHLFSLLWPLNQVLTKILSGHLVTVTYTRESIIQTAYPTSNPSGFLPHSSSWLRPKELNAQKKFMCLGWVAIFCPSELLTQPVHVTKPPYFSSLESLSTISFPALVFWVLPIHLLTGKSFTLMKSRMPYHKTQLGTWDILGF